MRANTIRQGAAHRFFRYTVAIICAILLVPGSPPMFAYQAAQQPAAQQPAAQQPAEQTGAKQPAAETAAKIPADQLDALVSPIALFPDQLLSQTLVASTYPLEIMQLFQWLEKNKELKDKALVDAVAKQPWDPSVQGMAALPDVVKRLADDIQWTTDLGNAFLAQQSDVMDAVQRMRSKAKETGALESNDKQKVETKVVEEKTVIVVEQANPEVIYVPTYNPVVVYGPPIYPYPAIYYPPYSAGAVVAASAISFGVGVAMGAAWGGGWGYGASWGHNDINVNVNNNFNRNTNINTNRSGGNTWQHNPQHRGGAPYSDRATADRFGSNARGESLSNRQGAARQEINRQGGNVRSAPQSGGTRPSAGSNVSGPASRSAGGADRIGNSNVGSSRPQSNRSAFSSGSAGGFSGSGARSSSSRGASSMRGGGGGGGGGRRR